MSVRRSIAIGIVGGSLAIGLLISSQTGARNPVPAVREPSNSLPFSTAWFCPATSGNKAGLITMANRTDKAVAGTAHLAGVGSGVATASISVPANGETTLKPSDLDNDAVVASSLQFDSEGVDVSHRFAAVNETATSCAPDASQQWTFVEGTTQGNATLQLALHNPFPDTAVANVNFATNLGPANPSDLEGVVIPARGVVMVDINAVLKRRDWIVPQVHVTSGRLAAEMLQGPDAAVAGATATRATAGAADARGSWSFGAEAVTDDVENQVVVFNPSDTEIGATILATAADGNPIEPFSVRVPAQGQALLDLRVEARIPHNVPVSIMVNAEGPVVAARASGWTVGARPGVADFHLGQPG